MVICELKAIQGLFKFKLKAIQSSKHIAHRKFGALNQIVKFTVSCKNRKLKLHLIMCDKKMVIYKLKAIQGSKHRKL